jgi:hypothetical protein
MTETLMVRAASSPLEAATLAYMKLGLSVIPLIGKKPGIESWTRNQHKPATEVDLAVWKNINALQNVGIICGSVSRNLVVLDGDGLAACALFEETWPDMAATFTVATGSGAGRHYYFIAETMPPTTRAMNLGVGGNLELRANGTYVVAAPSIHPETNNPYKVAIESPVLSIRDFMPFVEWLRSLKPAQRQQGAASAAPPSPQVKNNGRWAAAAMESEIRSLLAAPIGSRNDALNRSAYNLGQIVGDGLLAENQVEAALVAIGYASGLDESEIAPTIRSGISAGKRNPRSHQWNKR